MSLSLQCQHCQDQAQVRCNCTGDEMDKVNERLFKNLQKFTQREDGTSLTGSWERNWFDSSAFCEEIQQAAHGTTSVLTSWRMDALRQHATPANERGILADTGLRPCVRLTNVISHKSVNPHVSHLTQICMAL